MGQDIPPTAHARLIGARLRRYRKSGGHTAAHVAAETGISAGTISRLESGQRQTTAVLLAHLLGYYGATGAERDRIIRHHNVAHQRTWLAHDPEGFHEHDTVLADCEKRACEISTYDPVAVPPLLRTPEYSAVLAEQPRAEPDMRSRVIAIGQREIPLTVLVTEQALRRQTIDGGVMHGQLLHLAAHCRADHVDLRVLPLHHHERPYEQFTVLRFPDVPGTVHIGNHNTSIIIDELAVVEGYRLQGLAIAGAAYGKARSLELINSLATELLLAEAT
jgi:transcriptional regulator with XRE-family HTH domain